MQRRWLLRGEIFGLEWASPTGHRRGAFVVLDSKTEIEFWTGELTAWGDIYPDLEVKTIA